MKKQFALFLILALGILSCGFVFAEDSKEVHGFNPANLDPKTKPCADFYQFANGNWLANNPIPAAGR